MVRSKYLLASVFCVLGLAAACVQKIPVFDFFDASGARFNSRNLEWKPYLVLVLTDSGTNPSYIRQWAILDDVPGEELKAVFVSANLSGVDESGYHTSKETAQKLIDSGEEFQVVIYSPDGEVLKKSSTELSKEEITQIIFKKK